MTLEKLDGANSALEIMGHIPQRDEDWNCILPLHLQKDANRVLLSPLWGAASLNHLLFAKILVSKICRLPLLEAARALESRAFSGCGLPSRGQHHSHARKLFVCGLVQNLLKARGIFSSALIALFKWRFLLFFNISLEMKWQCVSTHPCANCWQFALEKKTSKLSSAGQKHNSNFYFVGGWYSANILTSCDWEVLWVLHCFS